MDLAGKLLIAMPGMGDPRFEQSVVFMCAHSESGAMGLIVNKPATEMRFSQLLQQLGITPHADARDIRVQIGGPVEHGRGFVLHTPDYPSEPGMQLADGRFAMTATLDILQALADGAGPERSFLALGYAGWGPGQLEAEIAHNGWLTCEASEDLVFDERNATKWQRALATIGVSPQALSAAAGRA